MVGEVSKSSISDVYMPRFVQRQLPTINLRSKLNVWSHSIHNIDKQSVLFKVVETGIPFKADHPTGTSRGRLSTDDSGRRCRCVLP